jgi:hypothetical protein
LSEIGGVENTPSTKNFTIGLLVLLVAAVIGVGWWWHSTHQFDSSRWKAAREPLCKNERGKMLGDVRAHHLHRGMRQSEVVRLLGNPSYKGNQNVRGRGVWWSWIAGEDLIDCATLDVRFVHGRLVETGQGHT